MYWPYAEMISTAVCGSLVLSIWQFGRFVRRMQKRLEAAVEAWIDERLKRPVSDITPLPGKLLPPRPMLAPKPCQLELDVGLLNEDLEEAA
jgi:hypothetical protein